MVYQIIKGKYAVFLESIAITLIILIVGISIGFLIESHRTQKIVESYKDYEIESLDLRLQNYYYQIMNQESCDAAIEQNFKFAEDLYTKGLELEKYEEANQITDDLFREKKRYVLLKTELWLNSILLKEKCDDPFDTVVYLYSGDPGNNAIVAQQKIISNVLKTVKEDKGNQIILLPIAADLKKTSDDDSLQLGIVEMQMRVYNITEIPAIIINEKEIIVGFHTVEEIKGYLR